MKLNLRTAAMALATGMLAVPMGMQAQYQQGPPPPPPGAYQQGPPGAYGQQPWEQPPDNFTSEIQRRGFHDGIEGARRDYGNHRPPNVRNRDEFRDYHGPERRVYRDAFRRGYQVGWQHIANDGGDRDHWHHDHDDHDGH